jgi:hypothetical protein
VDVDPYIRRGGGAYARRAAENGEAGDELLEAVGLVACGCPIVGRGG